MTYGYFEWEHPLRAVDVVFEHAVCCFLFELDWSSFLVLLRYSFFFLFFYLHLLDGVHFQYSQVLVIILFSERSDFFFFFLYFYSFRHLSFPASHYQHGIFFHAKFHPYILTIFRFQILFHFWLTVWWRPCTLGV